MALCKVNEIFRGEVSSVQNYGAFIKIPGCPQQGLVHRTQVSSSHVDDVADILQKGDKVWCKVISINEDGKIALSMKLVNQGNGKDLDPNGVQLHIDNQKKKTFNKEEKKAIVLDAVFKTICSKCKTPGHLAKDCFSTPDGKKYELLPEVEDEEPVIPITETEIEGKTKEKKSKKSKKRKKSKTSHPDSSDNEENDTSVEKSKKKKKKSKEAKHKKKKRRHSSSDSDSTNSDDSSVNKKHSKKCKRSKEKHSD